MSVILKPIFNYLISDLNLFDDLILNTLLLAIIGFIAFRVAFKIIGLLYDIGFLRSRESGSVLHWTLRLIIFVLIFKVFTYLIFIVKFIFSIPVWFLFSIVFLIIIVFLLYLFINWGK